MHGVTTSPFFVPKAPVALHRRRAGTRRGNSTLGLLWLHGELQATVYKRGAAVAHWRSVVPVFSLTAFEQALDEALLQLDFGGAEVSMILENDQFQHRPEQVPAISEAATRSFLKGLVGRMEESEGPILWVSQRTHSVRNEGSVLLHLLRGSFYDQLNGIMLSRRLELTRIVPAVVPMQLALDKLPEARDQPVLLASPAGGATVIAVGQAGKPILFFRCIMARWEADPARIGVEVNRSLLYAKQQFGAAVSGVRLMDDADSPTFAEVTRKCPAGCDVASATSRHARWLDAVASPAARHSINLVAGYLRHKQNQRLFRRILTAVAGLSLVLTALDVVQESQRSAQEKRRLAGLSMAESSLQQERVRLLARNDSASRRARLVQQVDAAVVPPVPSRFLAFLANTLPASARLTALNVRARDDSPGWVVRIEGVIDGDEDTAKDSLAGLERQLARSVFRLKVPDTGRAIVGYGAGAGTVREAHRFVFEGGLLED